MGAAEVLLLLLVSAFVLPVGYVAVRAATPSIVNRTLLAVLAASVCLIDRQPPAAAAHHHEGAERTQPALAAWAADYAVPRPDDVDAIKANSRSYDLASLTAPAVPELPPVVPIVEEEQRDRSGLADAGCAASAAGHVYNSSSNDSYLRAYP